jgi:hypothetical protein
MLQTNANQAPPVQTVVFGSGDTPLPNWVGDLYAPATINSAAGTTPQLLITGAPRYYITRLFVEVDASCTV